MNEENETDRDPPLISYLRLLRAPNLFTAMADSAMGFLFVDAIWAWHSKSQTLLPMGYWVLGTLVAASVCLYAAGVVLNDVFDIELDRKERPDRPLPAGDIPLRVARWIGWELLFLGIMLPCTIAWLLFKYPPAMRSHGMGPITLFIILRPAIVAVVLAGVIVAYNLFLKRTFLGPLAMGACRMLNVLLGMSILREPWGPGHVLVAGGIGIYIAGVTWFARDEAQRSQRIQLVGAMLTMLLGVATLAVHTRFTPNLLRQIDHDPSIWYLAMAAMAGVVALRCMWAIAQPSPGQVRMVVTQSIMALIFLDAFACYSVRGTTWALLIVLLILPARIPANKIAST